MPSAFLTRDTPCECRYVSATLALLKLIPHRCFGAASAKDRLDVVVRDAINAGDIPGPRYLANAKEIAKTDGELVAGITRFADGPDGKSGHHASHLTDQAPMLI